MTEWLTVLKERVEQYTPVCERLRAITSIFKRLIHSDERPTGDESDDEFAKSFTDKHAYDNLHFIDSFLRKRQDFPSMSDELMAGIDENGSPELKALVKGFDGERGVIDAPIDGTGPLYKEYCDIVKKIRCVWNTVWTMQSLRDALIGEWSDRFPNLSAVCEYSMIIQASTAGNERLFR